MDDKWPNYFMAVGMDAQTLDYTVCCGHFHRSPQDAMSCITAEHPLIQGVDVAAMSLGISQDLLKEAYVDRGLDPLKYLSPIAPRRRP